MYGTMYVLTTAGGDKIGFHVGPLAEAIEWARKHLEDNPEAGTLELYEVGREGTWKHQRTITFKHGNWQSVVVALNPFDGH